MTLSIEELQRVGDSGNVVTDSGDKIGGIGQIYVDDDNSTPTWVTVKTGLFGTGESFVPLQNARVDGNNIVVGYDKDTVKAAPRVDADGNITPEEEDELYRHYGMAGASSSTDDATTAGTGTADLASADHTAADYTTSDYAVAGTATTDRSSDRTPSDLDDVSEAGDHRADISDQTVGHDTSGPTTDDAMTLSEERLKVGTQTRESGRARLRKYVTTENVSQTVPVRHEEVTLEREPITDANRGAATSGPAISEEEHEVVLHEEVPVVDKDVVATERVKLNTQTVVEDQTVSADVRKEEIDLADPDHA